MMISKYCFLTLTVFAATSAGQMTGGPLAITQSVVGGGGAQSANGNTAIAATSGQGAAGGAMRGGQFTVTSGFWNFTPLAPTAAVASVSGRVMTSDGRGIRNAIVTLTSAVGSVQTAVSGSFGYYEFDEVIVGRTYTLAVSSKRFAFSQPTTSVTVIDQISDINFVADPVP